MTQVNIQPKISNLMSASLRLACLALLLAGTAVIALAQQVVVVNAASYGQDGTGQVNSDNRRTLAPDTIGAAFGTFITQNGQTFTGATIPPPTTLGGVRLRINNVDSPLFFVAPTQINFAVPATLADSPAGTTATVTVINSNNSQLTGTCIIKRQSPGIFSIRATGQGPAAAQTTFDGVTYTPVFNPDLSERDVEPGTVTPLRHNILVFYGTGIRRIPAANPNDVNGVAEAVLVTLRGIPLRVDYAGPAPGFFGLDQINVALPPEASNAGPSKLIIEALTPLSPRFPSNAVTIRMGGPQLRTRAQDVSLNETINGELTANDQVQVFEDKAYFFDAYQFVTTQANQTIAIDMRRDNTANNQIDSYILLYRRSGPNNDMLEFIGDDDQSGSYANGQVEKVTGNALLLMVLPQPGQYVIYTSTPDIQPAPLGMGKYILRIYTPTMKQMNYGTNLTGEAITTTDIRTVHNVYFDVFWFNAAAGDNVNIRMNSSAFRSYFVLQPNGGAPTAPAGKECNDGQSCGDAPSVGGEAVLNWRVGSAGMQLILATPFAPDRTGAYSISLNRLPSIAEETTPAAANEPARALTPRHSGRRIENRTIEN